MISRRTIIIDRVEGEMIRLVASVLKTNWNITICMCALTAAMIRLHLIYYKFGGLLTNTSRFQLCRTSIDKYIYIHQVTARLFFTTTS